MPRIRRVPGLLPGALLVASAWFALAAPRTASADEEDKVTFEPHVEPKDVGPGGKGTLVVNAKLKEHLHVYADKRFKVVPDPEKGVTFEAYTIPTKTVPYKVDPGDPNSDVEPVWFDQIEIRIPFALAADAPNPARLAVGFTYSSCDDTGCFLPIRGTVQAWISTSAVVEAWVVPHQVQVRFVPKKGFHLYPPDTTDGDPIEVKGIPAEGMTWAPAVYPASDKEIRTPYVVSLPFEVAPFKDRNQKHLDAKAHLHWQGCTDIACLGPEDVTATFSLTPFAAAPAAPATGTNQPPTPAHGPAPTPVPAPAPGSPVPAPAPAPGAPPSVAPPPPAGPQDVKSEGRLFEVYGKAGGAIAEIPKEKSLIQRKWEEMGILVLGFVFLLGVGLAFTPCVLPLIPITVSIIGGGKADLPRSRMTVLLCAYVLGLSLAFGSLGLVAALTGGSISAAFESPIALWVIASIFAVLAFGMFGVYELQPPQFLQRLQGGAKGGSVLGALVFGALGAVIASPCTGPVIVGMLVFTAQGGNALIGLLMFMTLGLGMGSVLFAAGSLNLLMRPGPWMVWVRYAFGVMLVGVALYYLASSGRLSSPVGVFAGGFLLALLGGAGIAKHLVKAEGEAVQPAVVRGAKVAVAVALVTGLVAFLTRPEGDAAGWITIRDRAQMVAEVQKAKTEGKATVFDVWGEWCHFCKEFDKVIENDPVLKASFDKLKRCRVDITADQRTDLRDGLGIDAGQPKMVFLDKEGRIHELPDAVRALCKTPDTVGWSLPWPGAMDDAREALKKMLREVGVLDAEVASAGK